MHICGSGNGSVFLHSDGRNRLVTAGQAQQTEVTASLESSEKMEAVWSDMLVFVKERGGDYVAYMTGAADVALRFNGYT